MLYDLMKKNKHIRAENVCSDMYVFVCDTVDCDVHKYCFIVVGKPPCVTGVDIQMM